MPSEGPIIFPGHESLRRLPLNYRPEEAAHFSQSLSYRSPDVRLNSLRNIRIVPGGRFLHGWKILLELHETTSANKQRSGALLAQRYLRDFARRIVYTATGQVMRIGEPVHWITNTFSRNYYHWMCEAIPRLYAAWALNKELTLLLPDVSKRLPFAKESLLPFGLKKILFAPKHGIAACEHILLPTSTVKLSNQNDLLIREISALYRDYFAEQPAGRRLFISREDTDRRRIANEDQLVPVLKKHGFETVKPERMGFSEQVRVFSQADLLLSLHGAGLTNMLFMPAGSTVIEIRNGLHKLNHYFTLANACGHAYAHLLETPVSENPYADVVCDPAALDALLSDLPASKSPNGA